MVVAVVAILTAAVMPWCESTSHETLVAAAQTVATDLAYARSLAVTNNSKYIVQFDLGRNQYVLKHSGTNGALDVLPNSIFRSPNDPPDQHIVSLAGLPGIGEPIKLAGVFRVGIATEPTTDIEFGPLGETTSADHSIVILRLKSGLWQRHAIIVVNPITGLATVHPYSEDLPSDLSPTAVKAITDAL